MQRRRHTNLQGKRATAGDHPAQGPARGGVRAWLTAALCGGLLLVVGCGDDSPKALPEVKSGGTPLEAGTYKPTRFQPRTTFEIGDGWGITSTEGIDYFDITREDAFETIVFQRVTKVPRRRFADQIIPAPDDLPAFLRRHPSLDLDPPVKTTLAGLPATRLDATVTKAAPAKRKPPSCEDPCLPLFVPADGTPVSYEPGDQLRFIFTEGAGTTVGLTVTIAAAKGRFKRFLPLAQEVLKTVKFGK